MNNQFEIKADRLGALLSGASVATSTDKRDIDTFKVINLRLESGALRVAATDRYIMARGTVSDFDTQLQGNAYLMPDTVKAILAILKPLKDRVITVAYDQGFIVDGHKFEHLAIEYPDLDKVTPTEFAGVDSDGLIVDPKNLIRLCKATPALIKWQFNGAHKAMFGTASNNGIEWQLMVMPCRAR